MSVTVPLAQRCASENFCKSSMRWGPNGDEFLAFAIDEGGRTGISGIDAIHVACAIVAEAEELTTAERITKPMPGADGGKGDFRSPIRHPLRTLCLGTRNARFSGQKESPDCRVFQELFLPSVGTIKAGIAWRMVFLHQPDLFPIPTQARYTNSLQDPPW